MASLKELAKMVGVSPTTVSFALNGRSKEMRISKELTNKILKAAEETGYRPNNIAVALRTGQTKIIGLIVENIANHFFSSLAKAIEEEANQYDYKLVYCSTENDDKKGEGLLDMLQQQQVDGYLITPTAGMRSKISRLLSRKTPLVLIDRYFEDMECPYVMVNNFEGIVKGVDLLVKKGYKKISFVTPKLDLVQMKERESGFLSALKGHGLYKNKKQVLKMEYQQAGTREAVERIKTYLQTEAPEAILFATNYIGIQGLQAIKELKLKVPDELAVVCFDDNEVFDLCTPAITAISQPIEEIGRTAVRILMGELGVTRKTSKKLVRISTEIINRGSA